MQTQQVIDYIVKWLADYQQSSSAKGFVIGVSGGIDSAVVSTLCARTGHPVLAIEMPIRQSTSEINRSRAHIEWLTSNFPNAKGAEVNLTEVFETFEKTFLKNDANEINAYTDVALANTRSRLRMVRTDTEISNALVAPYSGELILFRFTERISSRRHREQSRRFWRWLLHEIR